MELGRIGTSRVSGCHFMNFFRSIWYGWLLGLYYGIGPMIREMFFKIPTIDYSNLPKRTGETVVLTGGTRGIGAEVLKKLLKLNFTVIMGARNVEAGMKVVRNVRDVDGIISGKVKVFPLDLKSLESVQAFAKKILSETNRIDLIINNAGIMFAPWELTEDNIEIHFQVNYLSHFLLTQLLLPKMKETGKNKINSCRIVNVSSLAHYVASSGNLEHSPTPKTYSPEKAYHESKLCQVISTKYLDKILQEQGANVRIYSLHPGIIPTDLMTNLGLLGKCFKSLKNILRTAEDGAEEVMFTALSPELENQSGSYIQNTKVTKPSLEAERPEVQKLLYDLSQDKISKFIE